MAKIFVQNAEQVMSYSGSLAAGATYSASKVSLGFSRIVGGVISDVALQTASGISVQQSLGVDQGGAQSYDYTVTERAVSACDAVGINQEMIGASVVKVTLSASGTAASWLRAVFWMYPI